MKPLDPAARPARPEFDAHLTENVPVAMRDGVRLATDVYRPARGGRPLPDRRPVLLHRTPYNKVETEATSGQCGYFAARGYVVVNQDCRGCFGSEGDVNFLIPEAEDGADTIAWIRKQEWCDSTVGTFGTSWSGWTQTALAALGPEGLATMVPNMSGADGHESSVRHGGALELRFLAWAFWHSAYNTQAALTAPPRVAQSTAGQWTLIASEAELLARSRSEVLLYEDRRLGFADLATGDSPHQTLEVLRVGGQPVRVQSEESQKDHQSSTLVTVYKRVISHDMEEVGGCHLMEAFVQEPPFKGSRGNS